MKCLETRTRAHGLVYRQYEGDDGRKFVTYEIPATVARSLGLRRIRSAMATWHRGEKIRERAADVRDFVIRHPRWTAAAVATALGITGARVRQIRQEAKEQS